MVELFSVLANNLKDFKMLFSVNCNKFFVYRKVSIVVNCVFLFCCFRPDVIFGYVQANRGSSGERCRIWYVRYDPSRGCQQRPQEMPSIDCHPVTAWGPSWKVEQSVLLWTVRNYDHNRKWHGLHAAQNINMYIPVHVHMYMYILM